MWWIVAALVVWMLVLTPFVALGHSAKRGDESEAARVERERDEREDREADLIRSLSPDALRRLWL